MPVGKSWFRFSRTFWITVGSIVFLILITYTFGFQTITYVQMHRQAKRIAILDLTPRPLPTLSVSTTPTLKLAHGGYSMQSPWADLDLKKSKIVRNWGIFAFQSGSAITFCVPDAKYDGFRTTLAKYTGGNEALTNLVGPNAMKSDYALQRKLLEETSGTLTPWMSERESVRTSMLLMFKATSSVGGNTGLFQVEGNGWRGFQMDDPAKNPTTVTLDLYDEQDRKVEIVFRPKRNSAVGLTQQEINKVIQSLTLDDSNTIISAAKLANTNP